MKLHHFDKSLARELLASSDADLFYNNVPFSVVNIERYNSGSEEHMVLQRQDIDLCLEFIDGRKYTVSEKFRERDYNDLLLEIYSKYPDTEGWIHKSNAQRLAYFFPKRMFWIDKKALSTFCTNILFTMISKVMIERLLRQEYNSLKVSLELEGKKYNCILTQAHNNTGGDTWDTISISVPFKLLQDFDIQFQEFALK